MWSLLPNDRVTTRALMSYSNVLLCTLTLASIKRLYNTLDAFRLITDNIIRAYVKYGTSQKQVHCFLGEGDHKSVRPIKKKKKKKKKPFNSIIVIIHQEADLTKSIDHFRIVSIRPGWAHSQRRVGVNITIPLHWPSCEWTLTLPIFLVFVRYQQ